MNNELFILIEKFFFKKWEQATFEPEKEMEERVWTKLQGQIHTTQPSVSKSEFPAWKKVLRIAASILIPLFYVGLGYYFAEYKAGQNHDEMTVQVEIGQKANMQLPDGTQVWLNSAGSLSYGSDYNRNSRTVYLQGEAYFEVRKDKSRPFIVKTNDLSVEALGTSFNVKAYSDDNYITATLMEGSICVTSPSQSEILAPNEKLTFTRNDGLFAKSTLSDVEKSVSWINNQLAFEQERLEDIAKILERMYNIHIHFASEELKNIRFSGAIKNNSLESVLQMITFVSPVRYVAENDAIIVIHSK